jgi:FMN hydrolase / 5-amino-6-(5-phospho-D-ribitylamino)uracil phosphatase
VRTVIFDWGGTLTPWRDVDQLAGWRTYADVLHAGDTGRAAELAAALLAADVEHWGRVHTEHRAFTLAQVLARAGAPADESALRAYREFWDPATITDPQALPVLTELRDRGLRLGVLSSTAWPKDWHEEVLRRDGVLHLFDACTWSSDLPWTKPHPEAFRTAMAATGETDPAECVYIGDRLFDDVSGAKSAGMRAILFGASDIPPEQQVATTAEPDAVVPTLAELPAALDRLG